MSTVERPVLVLTSETTPLRVLLRDVVAHRDLLPMLARQQFRGQFRAARLGLAWSALQPLLRAAVLAVVFTRIVPIETPVPYPVFVLVGTSAWAYISGSLTAGTTAIASSAALAGRVYFPRLLLTAMPAAANLPSFAVTLAISVGVMALYGIGPQVTWVGLPVALALSFLLVLAASAVLSLLHVYFRDVGPLVSAGIGIAFYATPVIYPTRLAGDLAWLLELNPFTGAIVAIRWSLFGGTEDVLRPALVTAAWTAVLLTIALLAFRRHERICVDRL